MAGRDLPGPNSLDRKTKFQRNFNQLWWESERERERKGEGERGVWGERAGGEVGERWCREWADLSSGCAKRSPGRPPRRGLVTMGTGRVPFPNEAALGLCGPAELWWHRRCLPGGTEAVMRFSPPDRRNPSPIHIIFGTAVESVYVMLQRLPKNSCFKREKKL